MNRLPIFAAIVICAPALAAAQSATGDADLFPEDERVLRFGTDARNVTLAPFVQYDLGTVESDLEGREEDGGELRLARLYAFGRAGDLSGTFAYNSDDGDFPIAYAFGAYDLSDAWTIRVGQQDEPFSLQDMSGSRFLPFAEAGLNAALTPGDNLGVAAFRYGERSSFALGVFGGDLNTGADDEGVALTGRVTFAPIYDEERITRGGDATAQGVGTQRVDRLVHFGLGASARFDVDQPFGFAGGGGSVLVDGALATAPTLQDVEDLLRLNLEFAATRGAGSVQAEVAAASVEAADVDGFALGGYVYGTYFLTGERRGYDPSAGTFGRVVPKRAIDDGGLGAYELGARLGWLDLTDLGAEAGAQAQASLVANAYLTKRITATLDLSHTRLTAGPDEGAETTALTLRGQIAF